MSSAEQSSFTKSFLQITMPDEMTLLTIVAVAIVVLHIAVGVTLLGPSSSSSASTLQDTRASLYD